MEFSCEKCGTRYSVPDEKVRGKRVRTRCKKCGAEIIVDGTGGPDKATPASAKGAEAGVAAATASPPRTEERWTVAVTRAEQRKMTTAEIVDGYSLSVLSEQALVWKQGMEGWKAPFDVPALSLALSARGIKRSAGWREPGKSMPPPPSPSMPPPSPSIPPPSPALPVMPVTPPAPRSGAAHDALASDWDDENEATRVSEGALPFIARKLMADPAASAVLRQPALPRPPPVRPAPGPARAAVTGPADLAPAVPIGNEEATGKADIAQLMAHVQGAKASAPSAPDPSAFSFNDEATAVIAPDRARALLDAEAAKSETPTPIDSATGQSETPVAFGFDDESTQVIAPDRAVALLQAEADKSAAESVPTERPPPAFPATAGGGTEPSIVVEGAKKGPAAEPVKSGAPAPKKPPPEPGTHLAAKDIIHGFQNEPTRVVRMKRRGTQLWVLVVLALVAAAAGGFIASEVLARHHQVPARPHAP